MAWRPRFLGKSVDLPSINPKILKSTYKNGLVIEHPNHVLVMHAKRKLALYSVAMIDGEGQRQIKREEALHGFKYDPQIPKSIQTGSAYYREPWDKGHLAKLKSLAWGRSRVAAIRAISASNYYSNIAPQVGNYNRDEWKFIENLVLKKAKSLGTRVLVFNLPVFRESDPIIEVAKKSLKTPQSYCKVIALKADKTIKVACFSMPQAHFADDLESGGIEEILPFQRSILEIERDTGVMFSDLRKYDKFSFIKEKARFPRVIRSAGDIIV